jgi:ribosomal protein S18 acetylase RimI-like enzyme
LDQAIFGAYGADELPAIIQARLAVFPAGCALIEEKQPGIGSAPIVAYLTSEKWADLREPALDEDPHHTHQPQGRILNITTLAVSPQQQQRGLGQRLLAYAVTIARAEGCRAIVLETAHAEQFYLRHGFVTIGQREQRGIALAIMQRDLGTA